MRLLLRGLIVTMALLPVLPAQAQSDAQIGAMVEALRQAASKASSQVDGLYSPWKVKPAIIPDWSRRCTGTSVTPAQFEANPDTARAVVTCIMRRELQKQFRATNNNETASVRSVACWWLTGNYTGCKSGSQAAYVERVLGFYQKANSQPPTSPAPSNQPSSSPSPTPSPSPSPSATPSPSPSPSPSATPSPSPSPSPSASPSPSPSPSPSASPSP